MIQSFDEYAARYDAALAQGLSVSGEDREYFARGRIVWVMKCLGLLNRSPQRILDFGCGTGGAAPFFKELTSAELILGVDPSLESIDIAKKRHADARCQFEICRRAIPVGDMDLAFCNGVFHHIAPVERREAVDYIRSSLRAGGLFAFWENNPWNPGTRYVMSRIPFDKDAVTLTAGEARTLLRSCGFRILRTDFLFVFPHQLAPLRWLEPHLCRLPIGAQYGILCQKS